MKALLFFFIVTLLAVASPILAQTEPLPEAEYHTALTKALNAATARDRRILTDETFYTGPQISGTRQIVSEFVGNDAKKIDVVEDFNGKKTRSNAITLNGQFFCKDGEKAWKRMAVAVPTRLSN
ncbi:MAG: hypothetical protein AAB288_07815, partial [Acidobacteriota bacterium]